METPLKEPAVMHALRNVLHDSAEVAAAQIQDAKHVDECSSIICVIDLRMSTSTEEQRAKRNAYRREYNRWEAPGEPE